MRILRTLHHNEQGATAVEIALILPVILTMVFGLMETGYFFFNHQTVEKAAQMGSRIAATGLGHDDGTRIQKIEAAVGEFTTKLSGRGTTNTAVYSFAVATPDSPVSGAGKPCEIVEVKVEYTYPPITPIVGSLLGSTITFKGVERMMNEPWKACE